MIENVDSLSEKAHWDAVYTKSGHVADVGWEPTGYLSCLLAQMIRNAISAANARSILEIGCGNSTWLPYFGRTLGFTVAGIDYSEKGCELARARLAREGVKGKVFCADFSTVDPDDIGQFDLVFSLGVVEHFRDLQGTLLKFARFVKPAGVLLTEIPNMASIHGLLSWLYQPKLLRMHVLYRKRDLVRAYQAIGFNVQHSGHWGIFSLGIVAWGTYQRWPRLDPYILRVVRTLQRSLDPYLSRRRSRNGWPILSPFTVIYGKKS